MDGSRTAEADMAPSSEIGRKATRRANACLWAAGVLLLAGCAGTTYDLPPDGGGKPRKDGGKLDQRSVDARPRDQGRLPDQRPTDRTTVPDNLQPPDRRLPQPDESFPLPDRSLPSPDRSLPLPDRSLPSPDQFVPPPDQFVPPPDQFVPLPDQFVPLPDQFVPPPDQFVPLPDQFVPLPDTRPTCGYTCQVNVVTGTSNCGGPVTQLLLSGGRANFKVDLTGYTYLRTTVSVCNPVGWVLNIGNSDTNDGGGGDGGTFSNDSEVQIENTTLTAIRNDYGIAAGAPNPLLSVPGFLPASGCVTREILISDSRLETTSPPHVVNSPYLFRINQPDAEGTPDALLWVGLNKVVSGTSRTGTGLETAEFCLRN